MQVISFLCVSACVLPTIPTLVCATRQVSVSKSYMRRSFEAAAMSLLLWVGFPRHLSLRLWRDAWSMCSIIVLVNKILFNWVAPITFFSLVCPLKGSIQLGTDETVHVKNCGSASLWVPAGNCFFRLWYCFWITHLSSFLVKATEGSFRAGRKNTQIQPEGDPGIRLVCLCKWDVFCSGSEL